ncbi:MAG: hypothetical protein AB8B64_23765 [Granulosicoccus sp.]
MNDLLGLILVGLVLLTAVVSIFVMLTGPSEPYSEDDLPSSDTRYGDGLTGRALRPSRRASDRDLIKTPRQANNSTPAATSSKKRNREGVPG